jgi:hypothetical protein
LEDCDVGVGGLGFGNCGARAVEAACLLSQYVVSSYPSPCAPCIRQPSVPPCGVMFDDTVTHTHTCTHRDGGELRDVTLGVIDVDCMTWRRDALATGRVM